MTVARVASAEDIRTGTTDPHTFSYAGGTPEGIAIAIMHGVSGTALASSVSYGGVPLTLKVEASDTAGEPGNAQIWFLGTGIPTGTQTVSIDLTSASTTDIHTVVWELSGATDLEVIDTDELNGDVANPTVTLQAITRNKISLCAMYGGGAAPGGTLAAGNTLDHTHDHGAFMSQTCYETTVDNANHTIGWSTLTSDDVAFVAIAVSEVIAAQPLTGTLFTKPATFNTGTTVSVYSLTGVLFTKTSTFTTGVVTPGAINLAGTLLVEAPTFPAGVVTATRTLAGTLFQKTPSFPVGLIEIYVNLVVVELEDVGAPATDLDHYLRVHARTNAGTGFIRLRLFQATTEITEFEFAPTGSFTTYSEPLAEAEAAAITDYHNLQIHIDLKATATPFTPQIDWVDLLRPAAFGETLSGTLFTKAPSFPVGTVATPYALTGALFQKTPQFSTGMVAAGSTLAGVVFQTAPAFNAGAVTTTNTVSGALFIQTPFFQQGVVDLVPPDPRVLSGVVFVKTATFGVGAVTTGQAVLTGTLFADTPAFPQGVLSATVTVAGTFFTTAPVFPTGTLTSNQILGGVVFQKAPSFFVGSAGVAGTLFGNLFTNTPTFFLGALAQGGSFWTRNPTGYTLNPAAYTLNPALYVKVGPGDIPPWGIDVEGNLFTKTPSFLVGSVS